MWTSVSAARNESITLAALLTFKWIMKARNDKQLTKLIFALTMFNNDTLKINSHVSGLSISEIWGRNSAPFPKPKSTLQRRYNAGDGSHKIEPRYK